MIIYSLLRCVVSDKPPPALVKACEETLLHWNGMRAVLIMLWTMSNCSIFDDDSTAAYCSACSQHSITASSHHPPLFFIMDQKCGYFVVDLCYIVAVCRRRQSVGMVWCRPRRAGAGGRAPLSSALGRSIIPTIGILVPIKTKSAGKKLQRVVVVAVLATAGLPRKPRQKRSERSRMEQQRQTNPE
jgi:hypothetical protein